jgi:hypothetical protein
MWFRHKRIRKAEYIEKYVNPEINSVIIDNKELYYFCLDEVDICTRTKYIRFFCSLDKDLWVSVKFNPSGEFNYYRDTSTHIMQWLETSKKRLELLIDDMQEKR